MRGDGANPTAGQLGRALREPVSSCRSNILFSNLVKWLSHRQEGEVVGGEHSDDKGTPELPDFAKKADDLEAIKKAVDDASSVGGGLWLSYLFVLFYLAVAAGAVTHKDLFFEKAVKLPFLGIELPLLAFFFLAPILFVIVHTYTLVHLVMLTDKAKRYHQALYAQIEDANESESERRTATRDKLRRQLPSNIFIQFLAGPSDLRESAFGSLLRVIAWITLVVAPVLLLLTIQIQFLPYHSSGVVWTQRIALLLDLALVWWLWRKILSGGENDATATRASSIAVGLGLLTSSLAIAFSCAIATFPGEWQEETWTRPTWAVAVHDALFSAEPNLVTHRRFPFSNTLVLPSLNVYEDLGIDDPGKAKWRDFVFRSGERDLRGAIFTFASLPKVDFTGADLRGARLLYAQLQGASLQRANLQGASLDLAQLQGGNLSGAQLQGASLDGAYLQGADLSAAANLSGAQLQGASLKGAHLQGAKLSGAQLQGASLDGASLQAALLDSAPLLGVSFSSATLRGTDLGGSYLWRSNQAGIPAVLSAIRVVEDGNTWSPRQRDPMGQVRAWDDKDYQKLRSSLQLLLSGPSREAALKRIEVLNCSGSDKRLQSCDPSLAPPVEAAEWKNAVMKNSVGVQAYRAALAESLRALFCPGDENEVLVIRAIAKFGQLQRAGPAARALIAELLNKNSADCPVAASLTDADRSTLLSIKQEIESAEVPSLANPR
ncbi:hypothetical protein DNX69_02605 [Rhodopseudomonas palustris]|uniref:Pentapeptide repeat-containing protein n=1 Tax=Rhodopseudomonas palustris TaxID=1076 RepID=A0A323ULZ6_RHOPL|nr:hypothetical protein DNX69_02605 [Rhodopseudomonas palustris]